MRVRGQRVGDLRVLRVRPISGFLRGSADGTKGASSVSLPRGRPGKASLGLELGLQRR